MNRWDETWHRLLEWTSGQGPSERLSAQLLLADGFTGLDPSHPLGGKDGGKDATCKRGDQDWTMAVYFPRGRQPFQETRTKFLADIGSAVATGASRVAFVTNQELRLAERKQLKDSVSGTECEIYHLERITAILDRLDMFDVRRQFLGIGDEPVAQIAEGGKGGSAPGAGGGGGAAIGPNARGGPGGPGGNLSGVPGPLHPFLAAFGAPGAGGGGGASASPALPLFDESGLLADVATLTSALREPVVAKGGDGGSAGPVPPARVVEQRDLDAGLRVAAFVPADAIQIREGLVSALGLGWESFRVPHLPFELHWPGCVAPQLNTAVFAFVAPCPPGASTAIIDRVSHSRALSMAS